MTNQDQDPSYFTLRYFFFNYPDAACVRTAVAVVRVAIKLFCGLLHRRENELSARSFGVLYSLSWQIVRHVGGQSV